ncbi:hypothetical protein LCGC14_2816300 [marine sediment metagenome]|uniref:Uncharacterized protein n=1 Tax=marine sediment metagenome TaxID=412755 RepID=A0A0F8YID1_9ZZZZ
MKIADRIKAVEGVDDAYWDGRNNRLVVYYCASTPLDTIKIRVSGAIGEAALQNAVEKITFIG